MTALGSGQSRSAARRASTDNGYLLRTIGLREVLAIELVQCGINGALHHTARQHTAVVATHTAADAGANVTRAALLGLLGPERIGQSRLADAHVVAHAVFQQLLANLGSVDAAA